jgi:hypothetical protein
MILQKNLVFDLVLLYNKKSHWKFEMIIEFEGQ